MNCWLEHFTPFIQFVGAINIVYIATHFPSKVYNLFFNEDKIENDLANLRNKINAGSGAVQDMRYMTMSDGKTNRHEIDRLKQDYANLLQNWNDKHNEINNEIKTAKNVKGAKSLFLNITFYCILILLLISILSITNWHIVKIFIAVFNIITIIYSIYLTYIIWEHKWDSKCDIECYRKTGEYIVIQAICSFILSALIAIVHIILTCIYHYDLTFLDFLYDILLFLCVIIPVYPCCISFVFIVEHESKINSLKDDIISEFQDKQKTLDERKKKFEEMESMFISADDMNFGE